MLKLATKFAPVARGFEMAFQAGYRSAEFWLNESLLATWRDILRCAAEFPMDYVLHFPNTPGLSRAAVDDFVCLCRGLHCDTVVIHVDLWSEQREVLVTELGEGLFAVENHFETGAGLQKWIDEHAGITLDVEHLWKFTLDDAPFEELLRTLDVVLATAGTKLRHVHLPGYLPGGHEHRPMYCSREFVFAVLDRLAAQAFDGQVVSEINVAFQNHIELEMDRLLFERWRERHAARKGGTGVLARPDELQTGI